MTPPVIIPAADVLPLPAPVPLLQFLLHLTLLLHLLAMNALVGSLVITLWARLRARGDDDPRRRLADSVARLTPALVASAVTLGVAPLLFAQVLYGQFLFTSSIVMGWGWFSVVPVLILAYYGTYLQSQAGERLGAGRVPWLAVTVLLFLWIGFMYANNMSLMLRPAAWSSLYFGSPGGRHLNLGDPSLAPRYLHTMVGAVAVAGLMLAWWGRHRCGRGDATGSTMVLTGNRFFAWGTAVNVVLGLWFLMAIPRAQRLLFMGRDPLATGALAVGLLLGLVLVLVGWRSMRGGTAAGLAVPTVLVLVTMVVMLVMRSVVRGGALDGLFQPRSFPVQTQVFNLVLFALLLVGGAVTLVWMLRRLYLAWER